MGPVCFVLIDNLDIEDNSDYTVRKFSCFMSEVILSNKYLTCFSILLLINASYSQIVQDWINLYDGPATAGNLQDRGIDIETDSDGNFIGGGELDADFFINLGKGCILKYDPDGNLLWAFIDTTTIDNRINDIAVDDLNNIYSTGYANYTWSNMQKHYRTHKLDPNGEVIWYKNYYGNYWYLDDEALCLAIGPDYSVYVSGNSKQEVGNVENWVTIKYDSSGNQLWESIYDCNAQYGESDIVVDSLGNAYVCGRISGVGLASFSSLAVKYDPDGNLEWDFLVSAGPGSWSYASEITLDKNLNVYITGGTDTEETGADFATYKLDPDGNLIWDAYYNGNITYYNSDYSFFIDLDEIENVYITGQSRNIDQYYEIVTIKYSVT